MVNTNLETILIFLLIIETILDINHLKKYYNRKYHFNFRISGDIKI